jgi:hypothetical protein
MAPSQSLVVRAFCISTKLKLIIGADEAQGAAQAVDIAAAHGAAERHRQGETAKTRNGAASRGVYSFQPCLSPGIH